MLPSPLPRLPARVAPYSHPPGTAPPFKSLEFPCRPALPGPRWLAIPLFNNNIIRSRCEGIKLANGLRHPVKSAGSEAGSGGFRVQCWNQKMSVAAALLHFRRGFRRGFRRVPLGPGHANVRLGAKAPCQKWQVPWPAFGRPAGFSRDPREGPAAFWWGPGRFQVPPQVPAGLRRVPSGFGWV